MLLVLEARDRATEYIAKVDESLARLRVDLDKTAQTAAATSEKIAGSEKLAADETTAANEKMGLAAEKTGVESEAASGKMGLLSKVSMGVAAAFLGVGYEVVKSGMHMQDAIANLAVHANISTAAAGKMADALAQVAIGSTYTASQVTEALAPVAGEFQRASGRALTTAQSVKIMGAAMDLAKASEEPLSATTKTLADTMVAFHISASQAAHTSDILWNTSRLLGEPVSQLGKDFDRLRPRLAGAHISLGQLSGVMVELRDSLGTGRQALRLAGRGLEQLVSPTSAADKSLAQMGISLTDAQGKFIGLGPALDRIRAGLSRLPGASSAVAATQAMMAAQTQLATDKTQAQTPALKAVEKALSAQLGVLRLHAAALTKTSVLQALFGRQAGAMTGLIAGGSKALDANAKMAEKYGAAHAAAATRDETFKNQMEVLHASIKTVMEMLGTIAIPVLAGMAKALEKVIVPIAEWVAHNRTLVAVVGGVIGGVALMTTGILLARKAFLAIRTAGATVHDVLALVMRGFGLTGAAAQTSAAEQVAASDEATAAQKTNAMAVTEAQTASQATQTAEFEAGTAERVALNEAADVEMIAANEEMGAASMAVMGPAGLIIGALAIAVPLIISHWKQIEHIAVEVWHAIEAAAMWLFNAIVAAVRWYVGIYVWEFQTVLRVALDVWHAIEAAASWLVHAIAGYVEWVGGVWNSIFSTIERVAGTVVNSVVSFFSRIPGEIVGFMEQLPGDFLNLGEQMVNALLSAFSSVGSDIAHLVGGALHSLPGGGAIAHLLGLAKGGIVTRPTLAVVGESGPEAVIPLDAVATGGVAPLPGMSAPTSAASGASTSVYVDLRGTQVMSERDIEMLTSRIGAQLATRILPGAGVVIRR